jgi:hypothetical protein
MACGTERGLVESKVTEPHRKNRLIALEVRPQKFGFVIFEGPTRLLDWGVRECGRPGRDLARTAGNKISPLFDLYMPETIVIRRRHRPTSRTERKLVIVLSTICAEAKRRSINVRFLSIQAVRRFFTPHGSATKQEIASVLAEWFEDLRWMLPRERKPWQSEDRNMAVFDAAATGMALFARKMDPEDSFL